MILYFLSEFDFHFEWINKVEEESIEKILNKYDQSFSYRVFFISN